MAIILSSSSLWHFPKYSPYVKINANHFISLTQCLLRHHVTGSTIVIIFWRGHRMKETHLSFWLDTVSSSYSWQPEDCVSASYFINVSIFLSDLFLALGIKGRAFHILNEHSTTELLKRVLVYVHNRWFIE